MTLDLPVWVALPAALLLIAGGLLTLIGALGLLRLRDFYSRMHAPTMGTTLGTGCVLDRLDARVLGAPGAAGASRGAAHTVPRHYDADHGDPADARRDLSRRRKIDRANEPANRRPDQT